MATNKLQWKRIAKGYRLPCDSLLMKKDGTIISVVSGAGAKVGQDAYYLPVEELKSLPKEKNEDEKVRKALLEMVHDTTGDSLWVDYNVHKEDAIAWLEKQGEHANFINKIQIGDKVTRNEEGVLVNLSQLNRVAKKQGEQKPAEKIEPKFNIGDIITNGKIIGKVDENENNKYHGWFGYDKDLSVHYADIPDVENWHLWTIQDAKDGDVLCTYECDEPKIVFILKGTPKKPYVLSYYCFYNIMYPLFKTDDEKGCLAPDAEDIKPATKEQRDLLFQKMKEAGNEWDAEKKELKKIEHKSTWKPSDEQMVALNNVILLNEDHYNGAVLSTLYEQLKKLREE